MDNVCEADEGEEVAGSVYVCAPGSNWLAQLLHVSAQGAANRAGRVFTLDEFRRLLTKGWNKDSDMCLADWMTTRFCAITLLLGALPASVLNKLTALARSGQFDAFRNRAIDIEEFSVAAGNHHASADHVVEFKHAVDQAMFGKRQFTHRVGLLDECANFFFAVRHFVF